MSKKSSAKSRQRAGYYIILSLLIVSVLFFIFGMCMIWVTSEGYREEAKVSALMEQYKPRQPGADNPALDFNSSVKNPSLIEVQKINADAVAWLSMDGTDVDYIVVRGKDNREYLRRDIYGNYASAGTVFEDYRCQPDFSGKNTVVYGHNMKNGSMFGSLSKYQNESFFNNNTGGVLYLPEMCCKLEVFAFATVRSDDSVIYNTSITAEGTEAYLEYIKEIAVNYRDIGIAPEDRIVVLSTCSYLFEGARSVVLAKICNPGQ